jgi:hypothetical protein
MLSMLPLQAAPAHTNMSSGIVTTVMESRHLPAISHELTTARRQALRGALKWLGGKKKIHKEQTDVNGHHATNLM